LTGSIELKRVENDWLATVFKTEGSLPAVLLTGNMTGESRKANTPKNASKRVERILQTTEVRAKTPPLESFRKEAMPEENPKKTNGIKTKPPIWTKKAVVVYITCLKVAISPNNSVAASPKAVAAR
jgi:hypothetical protein